MAPGLQEGLARRPTAPMLTWTLRLAAVFGLLALAARHPEAEALVLAAAALAATALSVRGVPTRTA